MLDADRKGQERQAQVDAWEHAGLLKIERLLGPEYIDGRRQKRVRYHVLGFMMEQDGREPWPTKEAYQWLTAMLGSTPEEQSRAKQMLTWMKEGKVVYRPVTNSYCVGGYEFCDHGPEMAGFPTEHLFAQIALAVHAGVGNDTV